MPKSNLPQYSVVIHPHLKNDDQICLISRDFKAYKNGTTPNYPLFGRDAGFTENAHLASSNIHKVHIIPEGEYNMRALQYNNTCDIAHLVYCVHFEDPSKLCVIDFLTPEAHKSARSSGIVTRMIDRAEFFMQAFKIDKVKTA